MQKPIEHEQVPGLESRKASFDDVDAIHEIYLYAAGQKQKYGDHAWRDGFSRDGVKWMIDQGTTYCTLQAGEIVGVVALEWGDDGWGDDSEATAGYIKRLAVADGHHGQNLGGQILEWAAGRVRLKGKKYLRLDCPEENEKLCSYYEKQGFVKVMSKIFDDSDSNGPAALYQKAV